MTGGEEDTASNSRPVSRVYHNRSVWEAALGRIRWLFDEFGTVVVSFSGGKDSTVVLNLALQVAEERDRLPLKVMFLDQEAEWECVIRYMREVMTDPRVEPLWVQCPVKIFNATSPDDPWLQCWDPAARDRWMRPQEPGALTENRYGTDRFAEFFHAFPRVEWPDSRVCFLAGVRADESPRRSMAMTSVVTYKGATWGTKLNAGTQHITMYPIYDWAYTDVWKAIHSEGWAYCRLYDLMYQHGVPFNDMRVSNVHHETAVHSLFYLHEVESETWSRLTMRLGGINTAGQLRESAFEVKELPAMFKDWAEYRDYLLENLIADPDHRAKYARAFARDDETYADFEGIDGLLRIHVATVLANDTELTKLRTGHSNRPLFMFRRRKAGRPVY